jgi:hypothetical protein
MSEVIWQYEISLWLLLALIVLCLLLPMEFGFRLGERHRQRQTPGKGTAHGDVTLPALLALLGLMLAFTYSFSLGRADLRKQALLTEVNAISTAFLRADLVEGPGHSAIRQALLDYVLTRRPEPEAIRTMQGFEEAIAQSVQAQEQLWPLVQDALRRSSTVTPPEKALLVSAMNAVFDSHDQLIMSMKDRLPGTVLLLLLVIGGAALGIAGYNTALVGSPSRIRMSIFGCILAGLTFLILDFDMPMRGTIRVSYEGLDSLIAHMQTALNEAQ